MTDHTIDVGCRMAEHLNHMGTRFHGAKYVRILPEMIDFRFGPHLYRLLLGTGEVVELIDGKSEKNQYSDWVQGIWKGWRRDDDGTMVPPPVAAV